jgi:tetratricopeptide (TPR) repeat protein
MKKIALVLLAALSCLHHAWAQTAKVNEYKKVFTTYPFSDPNPIPSFTKIYPYFRFDGFTDTPVQKEWKVVELENSYIKLTILPEVGGKIWSAIEKSTNRSFIYNNQVVKFRDIAMRGPWTSGGIEANYGIIGHTPNCATPVDYLVRTNKDGSVSCIIGVQDLLTRTDWRIEVNLPADKAYFTTRSFWHNGTPLEQPYYHWMNAGLKAKGNLEFVFPGTKYIGHDGEYADWPLNKSNGKNLAFYEQNNFGGYKSYHVFGKYTPFFGAYWHDDDLGMVRYAPHDDKAGKKIWIWGLSQQGMIWEKLLTDNDGQYVELQSGRLFNQNAEKSTLSPFKHRSFAPYATDEWIEYWYPVLHTDGFVEANEWGAFNMKQENGWLKLYFSPVQTIDDTLEVKAGDQVIYQKPFSRQVLQTFADSIKWTADARNLTARLRKAGLVYQEQPAVNDLSRPVDGPREFDWSSVYGLYLAGKEYMDQKLYVEAEGKLVAALAKDPYFLPALTKLADLFFRNLRYAEALALTKRALAIDTHDGAANYYYGLVNAALGNTVDAKDGLDLAALSVAYRNAAYTVLSQLYLKEKDYQKALTYAEKALAFNRYDVSALEAKAIAFRYLRQQQNAVAVLDSIVALDPLNHFVRFENYLWEPSEVKKDRFTSMIRNEQTRESYLELATHYYSNGCIDDAVQVLQLAPSNALVLYWQAYLYHQQGKAFQSPLEKANQSSPAFIFPFRSETATLLQWVISQTGDWKPKYWLALIYKDRNRIAECNALLQQLKDIPDYAPFYAARALASENTPEQMLRDLSKAIALDSQEWRYHKLLGEYYIRQERADTALIIARNFYATHPANYIMGMLYAKTLLLNKQYTEGDRLLSKLNIIPFEGATEGRELYREAKLMQALQQLKNKKYRKSLGLINEARVWPSHLGVGKPYASEVDERLEDWLTYQCQEKMGDKEGAKVSLNKITGFQPKIDNTVRNFIPANALVTLWALEKTSSKAHAATWLNAQLAQFPDNESLVWVKEIYQVGKTDLAEVKKDASIRILEQLIKL